MLRHEDCESRSGQVDAIITDPPYRVSTKEYTGGEDEIGGFTNGHRPIQRNFGEWDKDYDPASLIVRAERDLNPGGYLVAFAGDEIFSAYNKMIRSSDILDYKATIAWIISNPVVSVRQVNFISCVQWIVVAKKKGSPIAWNWLGQRNMYNWVKGPHCGGKERLYWHLDDNFYGILPCPNAARCPMCKKRGKNDRRNHPTQKPLWIWEWLYERLTVPGMTVYDPYAGLGSSGIAARRFKLNWYGSEINEEFATVGQMWLNGEWHPFRGQMPLPIEQKEMF